VTDAIARFDRPAVGGGPVHGVVFHGRRYDTGDKSDYLRSIVQLACDRSDPAVFPCLLVEFAATRLATAIRPTRSAVTADDSALKGVDDHLAEVLAAVSPLSPLDLTLLDAMAACSLRT